MIRRRVGRARCGPRRGDAGISVVEVAIAAALSSLVIAATVTVFTGAMRSVRAVSVRTASSADTRIAMEQITRELRAATKPDGMAAALVSGTPSALSFYSLLDRSGSAVAANSDVAPSRIDYAFTGSCLNVTTTPMVPSGAGWALDVGHATTRCLLRTSTAAVFTYYPTGVISANGVDTPALPAVAGLAGSDLPLVQSVEISLTATSAATGDVPASQLRSRVTLTNVLIQAGG